MKLAWDGVKGVPPDNPAAFTLHFCPAQLSNLYYSGSDLTASLHSERADTERGGTERIPGCYPSHGFPFIRRYPASLRLFPQMKFLSHHQGEARAAWTRYAISGKRKEICKLNSLFIGIIGSHQLLIATPDTIKLHGLAESKITVLGFILADGIKWLNGTLETILS